MIKFHDYLKDKFKMNLERQKTFRDGYKEFKIGTVLKQARVEAGLTREELARKVERTKTVISRTENHAVDIRLSTLE